MPCAAWPQRASSCRITRATARRSSGKPRSASTCTRSTGSTRYSSSSSSPGFVISLTLEKSRNWRDFAFSRLSRLYPAYWAGPSL